MLYSVMFTVFTSSKFIPFSKNRKNGIYSYVILNENGLKIKEKSFLLTDTKNRIDLLSIIDILKEFGKDSELLICVNNEYIFNPISKGWLNDWKEKNFKKGKREISNSDLWKELYRLLTNKIKFKLVSNNNVWMETVNKMNEKLKEKSYTVL